MKNILYITALLLISACNQPKSADEETATSTTSEKESGVFGADLSGSEILAGSVFSNLLDQGDSTRAKLKVKIEDVCQNKGCWMVVDLGNGDKMRVTFKDYGFFVPKNSAGQTAVIEGIAKKKTTSVEELQHYAKDKGKPDEEIAAITEAKEEISFVATGVLIGG